MRLENHGLPIQKGIGGSAALCVSLASAMIEYGNPGSKENALFLREVNKWAFKGEVLFHGSPSGIDNTVSCYGRWCRGTEMEVVLFSSVRRKMVNTLLILLNQIHYQ